MIGEGALERESSKSKQMPLLWCEILFLTCNTRKICNTASPSPPTAGAWLTGPGTGGTADGSTDTVFSDPFLHRQRLVLMPLCDLEPKTSLTEARLACQRDGPLLEVVHHGLTTTESPWGHPDPAGRSSHQVAQQLDASNALHFFGSNLWACILDGQPISRCESIRQMKLHMCLPANGWVWNGGLQSRTLQLCIAKG